MKSKNLGPRVATLTLGCAMAGLPHSPALGQTELETTTISARKRSEPLQEVPVAAKTFSSEALADENIVDLKSLAARTASASTVELGASFASEVVLRGAGVGRAVNAETSTGLYRNGAYASGGNIGGRSFNKMDFFDVQRIEVMRGPQAALYGRGAVGGAMNIINVKPQPTASGSVTGSVGLNGAVGLEAILNRPLTETLSLRAGLVSQRSNGGTFIDAATGAALDSERFEGGRIALAFKPTNEFKYNLLLDGFQDEGPSFGVNQYVIQDSANRFVRNFNTPSRFSRKEWTAIGEGVWDFGAMTLTAVTQFKGRDASTSDDFDKFNNVNNVNLQVWQRLSEDSAKRFSQEVRLQSEDGQRLQWLVGMEFLTLKDTFTVDLNGAIARSRPNNSLNTTYSDDSSVGVFGLIGYDITPALNATLELRHQTDRKKFDLLSTTNTFKTGTPVALQDTGPVTTSTLAQTFDRTFTSVAKVVALSYKVTPTLNAYARYGEAFRPGGFNNDPDRNDATSNPQGPRFPIAYEQEQAKTLELGLKSQWFSKALRTNFALYTSTINDILLNNNVSSTPPGSSTARTIQYVENAGDARMNGIEVDAQLDLAAPGPAARWLIEGSANFTNTGITAGRFNGKEVPQTRPRSMTLGLTYQFKPMGLSRAFININTQQMRDGFQDVANLIPMDSVSLVNLNMGVRAKNWHASLNVSNATDALYITNYNNVQQTTGYTSLPRSWVLKAGLTF